MGATGTFVFEHAVNVIQIEQNKRHFRLFIMFPIIDDKKYNKTLTIS